MIKKLFCCFFLFWAPFLCSQEKKFPTVIDFSTLNPWEIPGYEMCDLEAMNAFCPFNGAVEFCPFFAYLKNTYSIETAVETGTWLGDTTAFLGYLFDQVYTMEIDVATFEKSAARFKNDPTIEVCYGNSPDILRQILPMLEGQRLIFYLDAHWLADWPLLNELEVISKTHRDNCIIVIDDFKVPNRSDIPYDSHGIDLEYSYECIRGHLDKIYSKYTYHYLIPKTLASRAKFVAIPKKWRS